MTVEARALPPAEPHVPVPGMRGFTATVSLSQRPLSSIRVGNVAVGRDGDDFLVQLINPDGIVLTASLSGYFFDRFADNLAELAEADTEAMWAQRTRATVALRPIVARVAERCGVPVHRLLGPGRTALEARTRRAACWVARQATVATLDAIARHVGYSDPASVVIAVNDAKRLREVDAGFRAITDEVLATYAGRQS